LSSFEHYGRVLTPENLQVAVWQALQGRPQVPMALHPMDGEAWLSDLMDHVKGRPLAEELEQTLSELLATVGPDGVEIGALGAALSGRPEWVEAESLVEALRRTVGGNATARAGLAAALRTKVMDEGGGWKQEIRELLADPALRVSLAPAAARFDLDGTLSTFGTWFTGNAEVDAALMSSLTRPLDRPDLEKMRESARHAGLAPQTADLVEQHLERVIKLRRAAESGA
jgi:hypothetical protein